jgi:uncharacterized protein YndB with AHSA1/START domain
MEEFELTRIPVAKTGMLIRRPMDVVFDAFVNPDVTTRFWFTKSSGRLEPGATARWEWSTYGISIPVTVRDFDPPRRLVIEWPGYASPTTVEWNFRPYQETMTFVDITESGFTGDGDELVGHAAGSTQGFTLVLAGLKALLEHDLELNLVADRFPPGIDDI